MELGIDIGTSSVKVVVVDDGDRVVARAEQPLVVSRPAPDRSEQDADSWIAATRACLTSLRASDAKALSAVRGIGLAGHMHALLLLDAASRPLAPAMLWNDGRAHAEAAELKSLGPRMAARMGVPAMAGFTAPKLLWLARREPRMVASASTLLLPKDYVRLWLTGELATDASDAAGTWLFDQASRQWDEPAVHASGGDASLLPRVLEANELAGHVRPALAAELGLGSDVIVVAGGGDTPVGGVGIGAVEEGQGFCNLGTSAQLFVATTAHRPAPASMVHAFCHALRNRWLQMAAMLNGASVATSLASVLGMDDAAELDRRVTAAFTGPGPLLALPYLAGERTPHDDPGAFGAVIGLRPDTTPEHVAQAFMEAVAFSFADAAAALHAAGTRIERLSLIGGGSRSRLWGRLLASVLDRPLMLHDGAEVGPALGAARLARMARLGAGAELAAMPAISAIIAPEPALTEAYQPRIEQFRALYAALRPFSAAIGG